MFAEIDKQRKTLTVEEQRNVSTESCGGKTDGCRTTGAAAGRSANNGRREYIALVLWTIVLVTEDEEWK